MPSTYSPNLKIELMATGEKSGQWGTVTNDNLQNALEAAIVGESTITFAGVDETLVLGDTTAPQDARSLKLNLTGLFAGTRTLNLPAIKKNYLIRNGSTGGDANNVIVKVASSAGATVTIPSGRTMFVYVDSVDVVEAFNHFNNLSIGQLSAPLPVTSGGTGATTFSSGALLKGNGTSAVSAASAADIVAAIGSTAVQNATNAVNATNATNATNAVNATNATSATNVTGTVGVANGGTGRTTLASGGLVLGAGTGAVNTLVGTSIGQIPRWDGTTWSTGNLPSGGVTNVTASSPLASSGGGTPNITLSGTVALGNGGTGATTASGARTNLGLGSLATLSSVSLTTNVTGTLPIANGGTGRTTLASGGLVIGAGTGAVNTLVGTSVGQIPQWNGSTWSTGSLPSGGVSSVTAASPLASSGGSTPQISLTGTVAVGNGGTGITTFGAANRALFSTSASALTAGTLPTAAGGTGLTGFSAANRAIFSTSASVLTAGTLPVAAGGTGVTIQPKFLAKAAANQNTTSGVYTKITFATEIFDTNNNFALSRFTPTVAGYYQIGATLRCNPGGGSTAAIFMAIIYKNGVEAFRGNEISNNNSDYQQVLVSTIVPMNGTTDYLEIYGLIFTVGGTPLFIYDDPVLTSYFSGAFIGA